MRPPRGLSREEAELWSRVARTVKPMRHQQPVVAPSATPDAALAKPPPAPFRKQDKAKIAARQPAGARQIEPQPPIRPLDRHGLDGSWERKLARAEVHPDFTLDLHGHGLDAAHARLDHGLSQAIAMGARVVLVIAGKPRPAEAADRGNARGAIRAKLLDWLAHGAHANRIAAVRGAHRKHGGPGAVYVVLRRPK